VDSYAVLTRMAEVLRVDVEELTGPGGGDGEEGQRVYEPAAEIERAMMGYQAVGRHLAVPGVRLAGGRLELADSSTVTGPVITNGDRSSSLVQVRTSGRPPARGYMLRLVVPVAAGSAGRAQSSPGMREHVDGRLSRPTSRAPGQWEGPLCPNHRVHFPISPAFVS
jgi:hypothetical protein